MTQAGDGDKCTEFQFFEHFHRHSHYVEVVYRTLQTCKLFVNVGYVHLTRQSSTSNCVTQKSAAHSTPLFSHHSNGALVTLPWRCGTGDFQSSVAVRSREMTEQMAQVFQQLQQLNQQFASNVPTKSELQRQQTQVQVETLTNLGTAHIVRGTYDTQDFQNNEKAWPD